MIVTFCGHSTFFCDEKDEKRLLNLLEKVALKNQVNFYLGGYGNFDNFALKCAKLYKKQHKNAKIVFVTPYLGKWLDKRKEFLKQNYDEIIYPEIEFVPQKLAIIKRNEWMIDQADFIFAYVTTHFGGAYKSLLYALKNKKPYVNLFQEKHDLY